MSLRSRLNVPGLASGGLTYIGGNSPLGNGQGTVGVAPPPTPSIVMDFTTNTATVNGVSTPISSLLNITRASSATITDAAGNVSSVGSGALARSSAGLQIFGASTNICLWSQNAFSTNWVNSGLTSVDGVASAPDGTATATTMTESTATAARNVGLAANLAVTANVRYTFSAFVKPGSGANRFVQFSFAATPFPGLTVLNIDPSNGNVQVSANGAGVSSYGSIPLANGWYRVWITLVCTVSGTTANFIIGMVPAINSARFTSYTGDGASSVKIWGVQVEQGAVLSPYIPTTSTSATRAADNITITGALATALAAATGTISVKSGSAPNILASTFIDCNGTALLAKGAKNGVLSALGSNLYSSNAVNWGISDQTISVAWDAAGGRVQLSGGAGNIDTTVRTPSGPFRLGSAGGSSNFHNGVIKTLSFYTSKVGFPNTLAMPLRSFEPFTYATGTPNPIMPLNTNSNNTLAQDVPYINTSQNVGGTFYALTAGYVSAASAGQTALVYSTTDFQSFTYVGLAWSCASGQWDDHSLLHPTTIKLGSTWYAYYSSKNAAGTKEQVGVVTSTDFINWTKFGSNPVITDNVAVPSIVHIGNMLYLYVADRNAGNKIVYYTTSDATPFGPWTLGGDAVTIANSDWDVWSIRVEDPMVVLNPQGYYEMTYSVENVNSNFKLPFTQQAQGYAISANGAPPWTKLQAPILLGDGIAGSVNNLYAGDPVLIFPGGSSVWMYFAGESSTVGVFQGSLGKIVP